MRVVGEHRHQAGRDRLKVKHCVWERGTGRVGNHYTDITVGTCLAPSRNSLEWLL